MTAAKTNNLAAMKEAIDAINEKYGNDPEKVASAVSMWDSETPAEMFMMPLMIQN